MNIPHFLKELTLRMYRLNEIEFESFALELFQYQFHSNPVYRDYVRGIGKDKGVNSIEKIPFLPIEFFKTHKVLCSDFSSTEKKFKSSGTTGQNRSIHYIPDTDYYLNHCLSGFEFTWGNIKDYILMVFIPEQNLNESSLLQMLNFLIKKTENPLSGFYYNKEKQMVEIFENYPSLLSKKIMVWGLGYTLLDFIKHELPITDYRLPISLIETGGMKGKRKELIKEDFYTQIHEKLGSVQIHSEYGMTELTSQFYAVKNGFFNEMPWVKVKLRDITDPYDATKRFYGGINIIDLANFHSCCFIETKDLGKKSINKTFQLVGRYDNSELRGCNLL